jgi:hypothetical protein
MLRVMTPADPLGLDVTARHSGEELLVQLVGFSGQHDHEPSQASHSPTPIANCYCQSPSPKKRLHDDDLYVIQRIKVLEHVCNFQLGTDPERLWEWLGCA